MTTPQQPPTPIVWKAAVTTQPSPHARPLRVLLYVALFASGMVALFGYDEIQARVMARTLAPEWRLAPAGVFSIALVLYAIDRVLLVRAGRFPSGKAFFQVAMGLALLTLLLPGGLRDYQTGRVQAATDDSVMALMHHSDARVRAVSAELAGRRERGPYLPALVRLLEDSNAEVRTAARQALERRTGRSMGDGAGSVAAWKAFVEGQGAEAGAP